MEVGPPKLAVRCWPQNHCKLRSSKAAVVSVAAKGETRSRQVWSGEASVSEPLMTCRNPLDDVKTGGATFFRDQFGGGPEACPSGIRHIGGAKPDQALGWKVRTCRSYAKGDAQAANTARARVPMRSTGAERPVVRRCSRRPRIPPSESAQATAGAALSAHKASSRAFGQACS